jgi:hypothetical protein
MAVRIQKPAVNIREKLAELERPIGVNGAALMATNTPQDAFSLIGAGRKNLMINGDFKISQRGNYTSSTNIVHNTYYLDRWVTDKSAGITATFRQITTDLPKQYRNENNTGLRFEATSSQSSAYIGFRQRYEFMSHLDGKFVTVSAWVKSNAKVVLINYDGSGGPYDYAQHSGSGQWEYLSYTTFITSTTYNYFDIFLIDPITYSFMSISSGDYVEVTNYQVEIGKTATPFEHRSYGEELALCQRYFYVLPTHYHFLHKNGYFESQLYYFPVTMRATPNITDNGAWALVGFQSTSNIAHTGLSYNTHPDGFFLTSTTTNNSSFYTWIHIGATIFASAEL